MTRWRIAIAIPGILLIGFGIFRLLTEIASADLVVLGIWLVAAVALHDGVVAPATVAVGWTVARIVPPRARRYLQAFLIAGGLVTVIALPLIERRGKAPEQKALLLRDYGLNLTILLAILAAISLALYAADLTQSRRNKPRPRPGPSPSDA